MTADKDALLRECLPAIIHAKSMAWTFPDTEDVIKQYTALIDRITAALEQKDEQPADDVVVLWEPIMSEREALVARLTAFINHFKFADDAMRGEAMSLLTELRGTALTAPAVAEKVDAEEKNHGWI